MIFGLQEWRNMMKKKNTNEYNQKYVESYENNDASNCLISSMARLNCAFTDSTLKRDVTRNDIIILNLRNELM